MSDKEFDFSALEQRLSVSRRTFLKFCAGVAASLGLPAGSEMAMAKAIADPKIRPPVIWLHGQECTGPMPSISTGPWMDWKLSCRVRPMWISTAISSGWTRQQRLCNERFICGGNRCQHGLQCEPWVACCSSGC